jgi:hypothetical protein
MSSTSITFGGPKRWMRAAFIGPRYRTPLLGGLFVMASLAAL